MIAAVPSTVSSALASSVPLVRMARLLLVAALAAFASVACAHPWIHPRTHVGALNHRLSREELFRTPHPSDPIQAQWMTQQLDHNDLSSTQTFQQRYFVNDTFYIASAPIVFFMSVSAMRSRGGGIRAHGRGKQGLAC